jgi:recombination protein RecT
MSNQLTVKDFFVRKDVTEKFQELLGENSKVFITSVMQAVSTNNLLANAEPKSIYQAAMMAAVLNLPINNNIGHAYIVPFNNRQPDSSYKVMAQFMIGYKGLKQLAIRSGQFRTLDTKEVYEGQYVEDESFIGFHFDWKAKKSNDVVGYACRFELLNGFEKILYMSLEEVHEHGKKYSKTYAHKNGQWQTNFDGMAKKTVTKLCLNSGEAPLSIQMQQALSADQAVINDVETMDVDYIDANTKEIQEEIIPVKPKITKKDMESAKKEIKEVIKDSVYTTECSFTKNEILSYYEYVKENLNSNKNGL